MGRYIQIEFQDITQEQSDILIAQLNEAGFEGFEETQGKLRAYISESGYEENVVSELTRSSGITFSKSIIEETNWNQLWESNFDPVVVDDYAAVRADFHEPIPNVTHEIIITPKMSFGTGHHATTNLMIRQMKELDLNGKIVFDFGTGTGVLAILAEKAGAGKVLAVDNDQWSYVNAIENIEKNQCTKIDIQLADTPDPHQKFDVVLANINKNIILTHLPVLTKQIRPGGCLLISGLLASDEVEIMTAIRTEGLNVVKKAEKDNWLVFKLAP